MTTALITGSTDGIGLQTALDLALAGVDVILHGRSADRLEAARARVEAAAPQVQVRTLRADLSSLAEVRQLAAQVGDAPLDILLHNAGVYMNERRVSADGFELTLAVNHLAPFLLTHLLLPQLRAAPQPRIINVSSVAHTRGVLHDDLQLTRSFDAYAAYAQSKLANVLFTVELARRLPLPATVNALHPGVVSTKLLKEGFGFNGPDSLQKGAATSVYLACSRDVEVTTGGYFSDLRPAPMHPDAHDPALTARFYALSAQLTGADPLPLP